MLGFNHINLKMLHCILIIRSPKWQDWKCTSFMISTKTFKCHNAVCGYKFNVNVLENIGLKLLNPLSLTLIVKKEDF